ncbi:MAG TPA: hypothetical protein VE958_08950 [Bryobacteraceae bacterium]|jgi:hypothetical protein|nr:hypothetical protein [Bryobacteraceae bacterium]
MSSEILLSLCLLVPLIYAGLYALTDPLASIRVVNKLMADTHRIEASILWGNLFAEPKPFADCLKTRFCFRFAGLAIMAAGLFRLYSL